MLTIRNSLKEQLKNDGVALGVGLRSTRTVDIARAMKTAGFDWLFIDMEHNTMSLDDACNISIAAHAEGIAPIVRVPGAEHHHATRALDGGAQGIVFPHVDSVEMAREIVANTRYTPLGKRSLYPVQPQTGFETAPMDQMIAALNDATFIVAMIECPKGVAAAHDIAAIPGIDALLIGTLDLSAELGVPGQVTHPDVLQASQSVIDACHAHGKTPGMGGAYAPDAMQTYISLGMRLILAGSDFSFMMQGAKAQSQTVRALL